jgi:hypothetical protein
LIETGRVACCFREQAPVMYNSQAPAGADRTPTRAMKRSAGPGERDERPDTNDRGVQVSRQRLTTAASGVPARLAAEMLRAGKELQAGRDPAAPSYSEDLPTRIMDDDDQHTRRVGDSGRQQPGSGSASSEPTEVGVASYRRRAAALVDEARAALDAEALDAAATAAEEALRAAEQAPPPGIAEVIEPARALLARVFAAYVGPLEGVPVLSPGAARIVRQDHFTDRERAFVERIDGRGTLTELFDGSGMGSTEILRMVARLLRASVVRMI